MNATSRVTELLEAKRIPYEILVHSKRFTTLETAEAEHVSGHSAAKVVMVKADGRDVMAVVPGDRQLSLLKLAAELGTYDLRIEDEGEFKRLFPDCEVGGMPPFGMLYGLPCYVDRELVDNPAIVFNAGSHEESIKITTRDYLAMAEAIVGDFSIAL